VLAERRVQYAARHVPDVLMVALPVLRPLRLLRFLVLLRMINRRATASLHGRIVAYVVATAGLVLLISAMAMLEAERHNPQANIDTFGDALWWAVTTMSTVGYGDRYPHNRRRSCRRRRVDASRDRPARCHLRNVRLVADRTSARNRNRGASRNAR
jgi:hypothetical protein